MGSISRFWTCGLRCVKHAEFLILIMFDPGILASSLSRSLLTYFLNSPDFWVLLQPHVVNHRTSSWIMLFKLKAWVLVVTCCDMVWAHPKNRPRSQSTVQGPLLSPPSKSEAEGSRIPMDSSSLCHEKKVMYEHTFYDVCMILHYIMFDINMLELETHTRTHTHPMSSTISDEFLKMEATVL